MEIIRIEGPALEPITYNEAKAQLRVDLDIEEDLIKSYITSAREYCENYQNRTYYTTKYKLVTNKVSFPLEIPQPPMQSVDKIEFQDEDGNFAEWDSNNYIVDSSGQFGWIRTAPSYSMPNMIYAENNILQITFNAGFDDTDDIPERVKNAIKLLVTHWYDNRVPVVIGTISTEVEFTIKALLSSDRVVPV